MYFQLVYCWRVRIVKQKTWQLLSVISRSENLRTYAKTVSYESAQRNIILLIQLLMFSPLLAKMLKAIHILKLPDGRGKTRSTHPSCRPSTAINPRSLVERFMSSHRIPCLAITRFFKSHTSSLYVGISFFHLFGSLWRINLTSLNFPTTHVLRNVKEKKSPRFDLYAYVKALICKWLTDYFWICFVVLCKVHI